MWYSSDVVAEGEILEYDSSHLIFTFLGDIVTIKVKVEDGENILELIQSDIETDEQSKISSYVGCTRGWTFYMANLKSILEGGIDLRNKNSNLQNVVNT